MLERQDKHNNACTISRRVKLNLIALQANMTVHKGEFDSALCKLRCKYCCTVAKQRHSQKNVGNAYLQLFQLV